MRPSARMFTDELTILWPGTKESRVGDTITDWVDAPSLVTVGRIARRGGLGGGASESNAQRSAQMSDWMAYFPPNVDIEGPRPVDGTCRVVFSGSTFEIQGPPYRPTTGHGVTHVECALRLVEG